MVQKAGQAGRPLLMPCYNYYASVLYLGGAYWEFSALQNLPCLMLCMHTAGSPQTETMDLTSDLTFPLQRHADLCLAMRNRILWPIPLYFVLDSCLGYDCLELRE